MKHHLFELLLRHCLFNALKIFQDNEMATVLNYKGKVSGKEIFTHIYKKYSDECSTYIVSRMSYPHEIEWQCKIINDSFSKFSESSHTLLLGDYFRSLYYIIRLIDVSSVSDKQSYCDIAIATLTNTQLLLLVINAFSVYGEDEFIPLILRYRLLKNLRLTGSNNDDVECFIIKTFSEKNNYREFKYIE